MKIEREAFSVEELKIINEFKNGVSIRALTEKYKNYGRTKIRNIIKDYIFMFPEDSAELENMLKSNQTHRTEEEQEPVDMSIDDIIKAYMQVKNGKSLTNVAKKFGRTRDYVKRRIVDYIDDELEVQEFLEILRENQLSGRKNHYLRYLTLTVEGKAQMIFEKLNDRREKNRKNPYSYILLNRKLDRLKKYFLVERNKTIENEDFRLTEEMFWSMVYDTPTLLAYSFADKIKPAMEYLDSHPDIGTENATRIIKDDASVLCSAIKRTNLQIRILKDYGYLKDFIDKPRSFRMSPELMYALVEFHGKNEMASRVFLSKKQLYERFGITSQEVVLEHDIKKKYGDDEYFDK